MIGKCKNCLGCNQLEDKQFKGTYYCNYYRNCEGADNDDIRDSQQLQQNKGRRGTVQSDYWNIKKATRNV